MAGTQADINLIKQINELDRVIFEAKEELDNSPLKKKIAEVREKKQQVKNKRDQVDQVFVSARAALQEMSEKDSAFAEDIERTQKEIEKNSGDYRKVNDASTKLDQLKKQREQIDAKLISVEENYKKIQELKSQIDEAIGNFSMLEDEMTQQFVEQNAEATQKFKDASQKRQDLQGQVDGQVMQIYAHALERAGANCLAEITQDNSCGVCRNKLSAAQMSKAEQEAPLSKCPHCGRLLICQN